MSDPKVKVLSPNVKVFKIKAFSFLFCQLFFQNFIFILTSKSFEPSFEKFDIFLLQIFLHSFIHSFICFLGKVFCVGRCNASCFGIFCEQVADKLFLKDSGGPEKDQLYASAVWC